MAYTRDAIHRVFYGCDNLKQVDKPDGFEYTPPIVPTYFPYAADFGNAGYSSVNPVFSSTSKQTMYDKDGVIRPVNAGVPLIDGAGVILDGSTPPNVTALVESGSEMGYPPQKERTNLALWYTELENLTINNSPGMTSVTSPDATAIGGYSTLITEDVGVGLFDNLNLIFYTDTKNIGDKIYLELYVKDVDAGQCHIRHGTTDEEFVSITASNPNITFSMGYDAFTRTVNFNGVKDWVKINVTFNYIGTSNPALLLRFYPADFADSNGKQILINALQVSKNQPIDRPIITTGTALTRDATSLTLDTALINSAEGTIISDVTFNEGSFWFDGGQFQVSGSGTDITVQSTTGNSAVIPVGKNVTMIKKMALRWTDTAFDLVVDGNYIQAFTLTQPDNSTIEIGNNIALTAPSQIIDKFIIAKVAYDIQILRDQTA